MWLGQVVSEVGDHFNNIAVFSLALAHTESGMAVTWVMLARAIPAVMAGPLAGVLLDRLDRRRIMIASDLVRALVAIGFVLAIPGDQNWLLYVLSGLLMFASPFFTSGRSSILPTIASKQELHTANSLTQTTGWLTLTLGAFAGGTSVAHFGYAGAFALNAASFLFSAWCISRLRGPSGTFRVTVDRSAKQKPWHEYVEGLRYLWATPLLFGIGLVGVGWATGGGAAQVLFSLFGEVVFRRGPDGIGTLWASAGLGLLVGGLVGHYLGKRLSFSAYKWAIVLAYLVHGGGYVAFSQMSSFAWACFFMAISRGAVAVSSVLNTSQLLHHVADEYRGRVFATVDSMVWSTMMLSLMGAGIASQHYSPRQIGLCAGLLSSTTGLFWAWAHLTGRLPEPSRVQRRTWNEVEDHAIA